MSAGDHLSPQQFFHGTRHTLKPGMVMEGGTHQANQGYGEPASHVYFTSHLPVAAMFAEASNGPARNRDAQPKIYQVEPVDHHEPDPHEPAEAQSYRSRQVRVVGRVPVHRLRNLHPGVAEEYGIR